ncbi:hypothetical protein RvY_14270-1 [Ramazzottius varieornatus]|uniref:Sulfatase N-terminal domain-containing protein n=1 Tax=Ramazzottius varieornatus TaxID=947166 RepID=A0A1D1VQR2_RAMVA|nr:hypothetical protein RvY_14270-1 [Ramazzottius varieornatus]
MEPNEEVNPRPAPFSFLHVLFASLIILLSGELLYHNFPQLRLLLWGEPTASETSLKANATRPHIVFILLDDLGWNDVSFHGYDEMRTVNIDRLAAEGVILNSFYAQYVCSPSRAALMTGKYPIRHELHHGVIQVRHRLGLDPSVKILPQLLRELGYDTHAVGKWHLGHFQTRYLPTNRGFDTFFGFYGPGIEHHNHTTGDTFDALDLWDNDRPARNYQGQHITKVLTEVAVKHISNHDPTKPMFLYFSHANLFQDVVGQSPPVDQEYYDRFPNIKHEGRRKHAATIAMIDDSVGAVMEALKRNNMLSNSIVVVMSDNGGAGEEYIIRPQFKFYSSNWPLRGAKGTQWEGGIRVATVVWSPLLEKPGRVSNELHHMCDWLPTFFRLAGGKAERLPEDLDGFDIWDSISKGTPSPRTEMFIQADPNFGDYAYRWKQYKVVHYETPSVYHPRPDQWMEPSGGLQSSMVRDTPGALRCGNVETVPCEPLVKPCLFDVVSDPCERQNVAKQFPGIVRKIMDKIRKFNESYSRVVKPPLDPRSDYSLHGDLVQPWDD